MTVFKNYFKIAKSFLPTILIYTLIFMSITTITSTSGANQQDYQASRSKVAFINHDCSSPLLDGFQNYLEDHADFVKLNDTQDELLDALFFRKVDFIMIVPAHFTVDFLKGKDVHIETMDVPDSYSSIYAKNLFNEFFNTAHLYLQADIDEKVMLQQIESNLQSHVDVELTNQSSNHQLSQVKQFYNFANYTLLAIIISVMSMIMLSFHNENIQLRHLSSALSYRQINIQLLLGNIVFTLAIWLLYVMISFILYHQTMFSITGLLFMVNSLIFSIFILVFAFFITTLTNNREIVGMVSTVFSLGSSFIAGAFVPQELLSSFVLSIAQFTPSYWFISNNNLIAQISEYNLSSLQPIFLQMGVILAFAFLFYILLQIVSYLKLKR